MQDIQYELSLSECAETSIQYRLCTFYKYEYHPSEMCQHVVEKPQVSGVTLMNTHFMPFGRVPVSYAHYRNPGTHLATVQ